MTSPLKSTNASLFNRSVTLPYRTLESMQNHKYLRVCSYSIFDLSSMAHTHFDYFISMHFFRSELLRVVDSLQLTANNKVATPADWEVSTNIAKNCKILRIGRGNGNETDTVQLN